MGVLMKRKKLAFVGMFLLMGFGACGGLVAGEIVAVLATDGLVEMAAGSAGLAGVAAASKKSPQPAGAIDKSRRIDADWQR